MNADTFKLIRDLLVSQLALEQDQVVLYNQRFDIPSDDRVYLTLGIIGTRNFGVSNTLETDPETAQLNQVQNLNRQEMYSLLIYSNGPAARLMNWQVPLVFSSVAAQQSMEANSYLISKVPPSMVDLSEQDGASRLHRYSLTFNALVAYQQTRAVEYFDTFTTAPLIVNP